MHRKNIVLSKTDRIVLDSYKEVLNGLAAYLGEGYEFVLHSLENLEHSVVAIVNGHYTNRRIGSPITDLALYMLDQIEAGTLKDDATYYSKNKDGAPLKSSTIAIRGEHGRIIGLLCINFYMNTPLSKILSSFASGQLVPATLTENFVDNTDDLVTNVVSKLKEEILADNTVLPSCKNKEIIYRAYLQGIFHFKDAVLLVADILSISKNTVYLHLRNAQERAASS